MSNNALSYLNIVVTEGEDEDHHRRYDQPERRLQRDLLQEVQRTWYLNTHVVLNLLVLIGDKQNLFHTIKEHTAPTPHSQNSLQNGFNFN